MSNPKSDVNAKQAYKAHLEELGYTNVRITNAPADIVAMKGGEEFYFEIKFTLKTEKYFGAATLTEWEAALKAPDRYRFVVARPVETGWRFNEFTPEQFLELSEIPPFKIFFRINLKETQSGNKTDIRKSEAVKLTLENLKKMIEFRAALKSTHDET